MTAPHATAPRRSILTVSDKSGVWKIYRGPTALSSFHSRGDAVRAACFHARDEEKREGRGRVIAQVVASPGGEIMPHYEPHFGL